jgi:hypothetical protein
MATRAPGPSPQVYARIGGALYLVIIVAGLAGELFVRGSIVVWGDAAATAANIARSEGLWRLGVAGDILMHVCDVPLMLIFYVLLEPVSRNLAMLSVLFTLVQSSVMVATKLNLLTALFLLGDAGYLKAVDPHQLQALAYVLVRSDAYGFGIGLVFFGFTCLVLGYLIFHSGYLPKALGVMMPVAGVCYLINSGALLVAPRLADKLFPAIMLPCFIAELSLCLWLLFKGVDKAKWEARAWRARAQVVP